MMMAWHDYDVLRTVGLSRHFGVELGEKLLHERVPLLCHLAAGCGLHEGREQEELFVEVVQRRPAPLAVGFSSEPCPWRHCLVVERPLPSPPEGQAPGNADSADGVQPVCVLHAPHLPLHRGGRGAFGREAARKLLAERHVLDHVHDAVDERCVHALARQKRFPRLHALAVAPAVLVVADVVHERRQLDDQQLGLVIAACTLLFGNFHRALVHPLYMCPIM
mmetsp:Transcript_64251/g.151253  ORF Transcript_64251/g.151253 Transcript_64251/m.151253 type:complete len:221 (-) Transcript_64251:259-921(-)